MEILSGYKGYGLAGALFSALLLVAYPSGATAQGDAPVDVQYRTQNCQQLVEQVNNVAAGDAVASGARARATVAVRNNVSVKAVQNCVQGNNNSVEANRAGGGSNNGEDPEADPPANGGGSIGFSQQTCVQIVNQYNNVVAGDAVASGDAAIAAVAARNNTTVKAVQNCVQGDGNVVGGKAPEDTDGEATNNENTETGNTETEKSVNNATPSDMVAGTGTNRVLSNTGGEASGFVAVSPVASVVVPVGAAIALSGLAGIVWITRRAGSDSRG